MPKPRRKQRMFAWVALTCIMAWNMSCDIHRDRTMKSIVGMIVMTVSLWFVVEALEGK